jgi:hypothetical protein
MPVGLKYGLVDDFVVISQMSNFQQLTNPDRTQIEIRLSSYTVPHFLFQDVNDFNQSSTRNGVALISHYPHKHS